MEEKTIRELQEDIEKKILGEIAEAPDKAREDLVYVYLEFMKAVGISTNLP
jgi:hypothetical protein